MKENIVLSKKVCDDIETALGLETIVDQVASSAQIFEVITH
jgi:hypothetical protein